MRKAAAYLLSTSAGFFLLIGLLWPYPMAEHQASSQRLSRERLLVERLGLTDICLSTEAAYTRHPNLADRFTPFQDHPMAFSHFPSESILSPPRQIYGDHRLHGGRRRP